MTLIKHKNTIINRYDRIQKFTPNHTSSLAVLRSRIGSALGNVHLCKGNPLPRGPVDNLVAEIEDNEEEDADIAGEEVARVPLDEDGEAVCDENQEIEEEAEPREVGLEGGLVWELVTGDVLVFEDIHKPDVAQVDERPADEAGYGRDV